jgi:hypothetical protein
MPRLPRFFFNLAVAITLITNAAAFSLVGPLTAWQTPRLGYNIGVPFPGGPMDIGEEYRINVPEFYYGFTPNFLSYFGQRGAQEIDKAMQILNELPKASAINIDNYPLTSQRVNHRAAQLALADLKSVALTQMLYEMGLGDPVRFVFTLRSRWIGPGGAPTNFYVINRNFDPATWRPTTFINGQLWTYSSVQDVNEAESFVFSTPVDPLSLFGFANAPVASGLGWGQLLIGGFWTGLTRDDVGGIRYIYRRDNYNVETAATNATGTLGGGAWGPPPGTTNVAGTNFVSIGLREGREKILFRRVNFDSVQGIFEPFTNTFTDTFITNAQRVTQNLQRAVVAPDILFHVADVHGGDASIPLISFFYTQQVWSNNESLNGVPGIPINYGPGVIDPGAGGPALTVTFNSLSHVRWNVHPNALTELDGLPELGFFWGSFDGTTNEPIVYPIGIEVRDLERFVLSGEGGSGWRPPPTPTTPPPDAGTGNPGTGN